MKLDRKLILLTVVPLLIVLVSMMVLTEVTVKRSLEANAYSYTDSVAEKSAVQIESLLNTNLNAVKGLARDIEALQAEKMLTRDNARTLLIDYIKRNNTFGMGVYLEDNLIDPDINYANKDQYDETGRFYPYIYHAGKELINDYMTLEDGGEHWYEEPKKLMRGIVTDPYTDFFETEDSKGEEKPVLMVTASTPIVINGKFSGVVINDLLLDVFMNDVVAIKPYGTGFAHLISNDGQVVATEHKDLIGKSIGDIDFMKEYDPKLIAQAVKDGKDLHFAWYDTFSKQEIYSVLYPIVLTDNPKPWGLLVSVHKKSAYEAVGLPKIRLQSRITQIFILVIMIITVFFVRRFVVRYVKQFVKAFKDVTEGDGDLTKTLQIKSGDEFEVLAGYLNKFLGNLSIIISQLKENSNTSIKSTDDMSTSAQELVTTFRAQSTEVETVVSAMEEMTASAGEVRVIIGDNNVVVHEAGSKISNGQESLKGVLHSIEMIKEKTQSLSSTVGGLSASSDKIGTILNVINDIADQTNLLALNAAIEAARAGDAGRGFAVVADEVRKLAERTQKATNEIKVIITELQSGASQAAKEMNEAGRSVDEGVVKTENASKIFNEIVTAVEAIQQNSSHIGLTIEQQIEAIQGVNNSAHAMSESINESNIAVTTFSSTVDTIAGEAKQTGKLLSRFKV